MKKEQAATRRKGSRNFDGGGKWSNDAPHTGIFTIILLLYTGNFLPEMTFSYGNT